MKRPFFKIACILFLLLAFNGTAMGFWIWTPESKTIVNPKFVVKDTPQEQFEWAMSFYKNADFKRAADEFIRLTKHYPDAREAPEAQYYAGRSFEELGKYFFAFENYQKTVENYPYTKRMEEINEREFKIANILQSQESPKLMDLELSLALDRAITIYDKIVENSPFGPYADRSLFEKAACARKLQRYKEAIEAYDRIIKDYPESDLVPEARYQLAYTRYEASLQPEYDQESTEKALREFKQISENTPVPAISEEARKVIDELKEKKAASMMKIARFYEKRGKPQSALIYYKDIVGKYKGTIAAEEAKKRIKAIEEKR
jgi:outer membrane assembly lipoprotein YfiO